MKNAPTPTTGFELNFTNTHLASDGQYYATIHGPRIVEHINGTTRREVIRDEQGPVTGYTRLNQEEICTLLAQGKRISLPMRKEKQE